ALSSTAAHCASNSFFSFFMFAAVAVYGPISRNFMMAAADRAISTMMTMIAIIISMKGKPGRAARDLIRMVRPPRPPDAGAEVGLTEVWQVVLGGRLGRARYH